MNYSAYMRRMSVKELKANIKMQFKHVRDAQKDIAYLKSELAELEAALGEKLGEKVNFKKDSEKLLKNQRPKSSVARWNLFKKIVRRYSDRTMWMDRIPGSGKLSVKIGNGREFPKRVESILRELADSFKVYDVHEYMGDTHRGTRFYFNNIPGTSKHAPKKRHRNFNTPCN
jgi:hypothetical protein